MPHFVDIGRSSRLLHQCPREPERRKSAGGGEKPGQTTRIPRGGVQRQKISPILVSKIVHLVHKPIVRACEAVQVGAGTARFGVVDQLGMNQAVLNGDLTVLHHGGSGCQRLGKHVVDTACKRIPPVSCIRRVHNHNINLRYFIFLQFTQRLTARRITGRRITNITGRRIIPGIHLISPRLVRISARNISILLRNQRFAR